MDQIKIGIFIATLRKEQGLTQRQLAEKLSISDKTISKWECGKGLPEVSLMMPLCELLGITVNELLSGERLEKEKYEDKAEENMLNLMIEHKKKELRSWKNQCIFYSSFYLVVRLSLSWGFAYEVMTLAIWLFLSYCIAEFFASFWRRSKGKIDGYDHFTQLIIWSILFFIGWVLKAFIDATFTGTGRIF